jgi:membrane-associated protease RseP (regulator of RpoE activity)
MRSPESRTRPARHWRWLPLLALLVWAAPAAAWEPKCPLDIATCLGQFERMKERPWLGILVDVDSLGHRTIQGTEAGSPAERAGFQKGDVLETIEGQTPASWFSGKAGWKTGDTGVFVVRRGKEEKSIMMRYEVLPEDVLARRIGVHMIEGHLAYMHKDSDHKELEKH